MKSNKKTNSDEITKAELLQMFKAIKTEIQTKPPTIGIIGVSGVGKSSTINTLFRTGLETSDTIACTKEFWSIGAKAQLNIGEKKKAVNLIIKDAPGLGEDMDLDPKYLKMYKDNLDDCDVILWVLAARNRAIALDQQYLLQLKEFHNKMVFAINQVDLVEPMNWDKTINLPSGEQEKNINIIVDDRKRKISKTLGELVEMIPYSAKSKYNLEELFSALLKKCPVERSWIFDAIKGFHFTDFIPESIKSKVIDEFNKKEEVKIDKSTIRFQQDTGETEKTKSLIQKGFNLLGKFKTKK